MMKKLILFFSLLATITMNAQASYKITLNEFVTENNVFDVPGKSAEELYSLTKVWMAQNYEKPDRIIIGDTKNVLIKIKYFFEIPSVKRNLKIKYHLLLDFKEGKVRISFDNIERTQYFNHKIYFNKDGSRRSSKDATQYLNDIDNYVTKFVNDYIHYLKGNGNW